MPTDSAACKIDVPFLASTTFPSIVNVPSYFPLIHIKTEIIF